MAPCLTTTKENNDSMEFALDDDSTCVSVAIADNGTCQKHPHIILYDSAKGIINNSCPECDKELQSQRKILKGKRRELEKQLEELNQDGDDDTPNVYPDDCEKVVAEPQTNRTTAGVSFPDIHNHDTMLLRNQVAVVQQMSNWMLQQKEKEIALLQSQVDKFRNELLQKEVENALLKEKLKLKDERLEQEMKLRELWKKNTPASHKNREAKDNNSNIHIQEIIVQVGARTNSKKGGSETVVEEEKIVNPKEIEAVTKIATEEAKGRVKDEYINVEKNINPGATVGENETKHDVPLSPQQEIKFVPAFIPERKPIERENEEVKDTQKEKKAKDLALYNLTTLKSPQLSFKEPSVQNSEDTSETQQTKNTFSNDDKRDAYHNVFEEKKDNSPMQENINFLLREDMSTSEELQLDPSTFLAKSSPPQHIISRSLKVPVLESLKKSAPKKNNKKAADIALNFGMTGLPPKESLNRKRCKLPPGIPEEIEPDECPSVNNDELTLPSMINTDQTYEDNITCATSTCYEDRLKVVDRKLSDPYGDTGVYTGVLLRSTMMPHGPGRMVYDDDRRNYDGEWRHGRWHGYGSATFPNGDTYVGDFKFDQRHGTGKYCWIDGRMYDGDFREDRRHGKGLFQWPDGATYTGDFQQGKRHGNGKYSFVEGGYYEGAWTDGRYEGYGECVWNDGRSYKGEWCAGLAHGKGVETFPDGRVRHDGEWFEDEPVRATSNHADMRCYI